MSGDCQNTGHRKEDRAEADSGIKDKFDLQEAFEQKLAGNQAAAAVRQAGEPDAFQDAVQALTALGYSERKHCRQ